MQPSSPGSDGMVIGVAFSVKHDGEVRVDGVMPDSPAHKARRPPVVGDQLLRVNGQMIPALISKQELTLLLADQCWKSSTLSLGFRADSWKEYTSVIQVQPRGSFHSSRNLLSVLEEEKVDTSRERDGYRGLAHNLAPPVPLVQNQFSPDTMSLYNRRHPGSQPRQGGPSDSLALPLPIVLRPGLSQPANGTQLSPANRPAPLSPANRPVAYNGEGTMGWEVGGGPSPLYGGSFDPVSIQEAWGGWEPGSSDKKLHTPKTPSLVTHNNSWNGQNSWSGQSPVNGQSPWNGWRASVLELRTQSTELWKSSGGKSSGGSDTHSRRDLRLGGTPSPPPSGDRSQRSSRSAGSERLPSSLRVLVDEMKEEVMAVRTMAEEKIIAAERGREAVEDELAALQDETFERVQGMQEQLSSLKAENRSLRLQLSRLNQRIDEEEDQPEEEARSEEFRREQREPHPAHRPSAAPPAHNSTRPAPLRPQQRSQPIYPPHFLSQSSFKSVSPPSSRLATHSDITWTSALPGIAPGAGAGPGRAAAAPLRPEEVPSQPQLPLVSDSAPDPEALFPDSEDMVPMLAGAAQAASDGSEESRTSAEARTALFAVTMEDGNELRIDPSTGRVVGQAPEDDEGLELL